MLESIDFHYDGISSKMMGLMNVTMDSGLFEEIFLPSRSIEKEKPKGSIKSYHQNIEYSDIKIPLTFLMPDRYTMEQEREIKQWLFQPYYKEFYFDLYPDKIFYLMYNGDISIHHNGLGQGYITLEMESNSGFAYSPVYNPYKITVDNLVDGYKYYFDNQGDFPLLPELWITNKGVNGHDSVKIINNVNGEVFEFTGLTSSSIETIYINNEKEEIESSLPLTYRYDNFNGNWLKLAPNGTTTLTIIGKCDIEFRFQYTYLP